MIGVGWSEANFLLIFFFSGGLETIDEKSLKLSLFQGFFFFKEIMWGRLMCSNAFIKVWFN